MERFCLFSLTQIKIKSLQVRNITL